MVWALARRAARSRIRTCKQQVEEERAIVDWASIHLKG